MFVALALAGIAYAFFTVAAVAFCLAFWVASEARFRVLINAISAGANERQARVWGPRYALILILFGLQWLALGILFLLLANYSVVGEIM